MNLLEKMRYEQGKIQLEKNLDIQFEQRKQYLEDPNFDCLSDILTNADDYRTRSDAYVFIYLMYGYVHWTTKHFCNISVDDLDRIYLLNFTRPEINWKGIYEYYQARAKTVRDHGWHEPYNGPLEDVLKVLEKHKDAIAQMKETKTTLQQKPRRPKTK